MPHSVHSMPPLTTSDGHKYWNSNLPPEQWTAECPPFLVGIPAKNENILLSRQEDHEDLTWEQAQHLVAINRIDSFQRSPLELRAYLGYVYDLQQSYGSVLSFIKQHRLRWDDTAPSEDAPFTNSSDYKVLYNDWPYAVEKDIVHLVVWTKFVLGEDAKTGDLTTPARRMVEDFVRMVFCGEGGMRREDVVWFKNWRSLKSVHAIEHFHVMLYKPPEGLAERITKGDQPECHQRQ